MPIPAGFPSHLWIPEPELVFHPERPQDRDSHPLNGLLRFGPFSRSLVNRVMDPIRLASITPNGYGVRLERLAVELEGRHKPRERPQYLPQFPGFPRAFGLRAVLTSNRIELSSHLDEQISSADAPHWVLASELTRAISAMEAHRTEFDVLLILLPNRWEAGFTGRESEDFDLHDYLKAVSASRAIPLQILREDKALAYFCRCSVMWRLSIALYTKAGGVPWKLADHDPDTAFIGLSYSVRQPASEEQQLFVTCCSQVFDEDGAGLEFIAYETDDVHLERDNPFLSRTEMRRVMARSLALYQRRHGGRAPKRVVAHKSTEFKPQEVEGCFDAWRSAEGLELIQVQQDVSWRGVRIEPPKGEQGPKGVAANYPIERGSYLQLSGREVLVWTQGNAATVVGGRNYYKEGKGIPSPLLLRRFAGHGGWDQAARDVLGLTKMDWNNDALYDRLPVTMAYAAILARTIKRMPELAPRPYQFRFFM